MATFLQRISREIREQFGNKLRPIVSIWVMFMRKLWKLFGAYEVLIVLTIIVTKSDKPSPNAWQNCYELKAKMHFILASLVRRLRQFIDKIAPY